MVGKEIKLLALETHCRKHHIQLFYLSNPGLKNYTRMYVQETEREKKCYCNESYSLQRVGSHDLLDTFQFFASMKIRFLLSILKDVSS